MTKSGHYCTKTIYNVLYCIWKERERNEIRLAEKELTTLQWPMAMCSLTVVSSEKTKPTYIVHYTNTRT